VSTPRKASDGAVKGFAKKAARGVARRMREFGAVEAHGFDLSDVPSADVALYFADGPTKLYQLTQWLPVFEANPDMTTIVVVRHIETYRTLLGLTSLRVLLVPRYEILMALYDRADFHAVVYVNNGWTNFQSLSFQQAVHIHVNHGESDKICMVSNQAKAYDKVFVAGEAAVRRHAAALAWFDPSHLVRVGRPQLDLPVPDAVPPVDGPTITYAPTWEGEDDANNYTSVDRYGPQVVAAGLAQPGARVLYKPHPRVATSGDPGVARGHQQILRLMDAAIAADPGRGHAVLMDADVLGVIRVTDLMIADVSSVSLDHLYLRPDAPLAICDRRSDRARLLEDAPVASGALVVDGTSVDALADEFAALLADDTLRQKRHELRDFYFDSLAPGESTTRFWSELASAIHHHDAALRELSRVRHIEEIA
jgi:CDP-Glycerol:Poly(glycerophosphate) glycerophosphotransferase